MVLLRTKKKRSGNAMDRKNIDAGDDQGQVLGFEPRLASLAATISPAEKRERGQLAEFLHDDVCQFLSLAQIKLSMSRQTDDVEERAQLAASAEDLVKRANRAVRAMMLRLVHSRPSDDQLVGDVQWVAQDIEQLYGIKVHLMDDGQPMGVPVRTAIVQCLRELLVNVAKHAHTNEASVSIARSGETVRLIVDDEGAGFALDSLMGQRDAGGFGLSSIRQRIRSLGGRVCVCSEPAKGTTITIEVPDEFTTVGDSESW